MKLRTPASYRHRRRTPRLERERAASVVAQVQLPERLNGRPGHFNDVKQSTLAEWRILGEAGQLLAGVRAGYTLDEIAARRAWRPGAAAEYLAQADAWYARRRGGDG